MRNYVWVFSVFLCCVSRVVATDYYVATNGTVGAAGSFVDPFSSIQEAAGAVGSGGTIYIRGGKYHEAITIKDLVGTSGRRITFQNYSNEEVVIAGTLPIAGNWSPWSRNSKVWKTTVPQDIWQLFVDGKCMTAARWPNVRKDWMEPDDSNGYDPTPFSYWDQESTWAHLTDASMWGHFFNNESMHNLATPGRSFEGAVLNGFRCMVSGNDFFSEIITHHDAGSSQFLHTTETYAADAKAKQPPSGARYYIEGDIDCLDAPGEWFYDKATGELYLWFSDDGGPEGCVVEGKIHDDILTLDHCEFLEFRGLTLLGGAFVLNSTYDTAFEECRFLYSSYGKRTLGEPVPGGMIDPRFAPFNRTGGKRNPANLVWRDCEFMGSEGISLYIRTFGSNLVENCWFHNAQFGRTLYGAVSDKKGSGSTIRNCTFHTLGMQNATKNGPDGLIENNMAYNFMLKGDFSVFQIPQPTQPTTVVRYNWAINGADRNGIRFDGDSANTNCLVHHTVAMNNNRGFRMKGDKHRIYNITGLGNSPKSDINMAREKFYGYDGTGNLIAGRRGDHPYHGNENSIVRNIAGDVIDNWPLQPTNAVGVWHGNILGKTLMGELRDPLNFDFRPKSGSDLIDAGTMVPGITETYFGNAPDLGAYEFGDSHYWIPGCTFKQASVPIPRTGSLAARTDTDLMWKPGKDAVSHNIHFGTATTNLVFVSHQANNIYSPGTLNTNDTYYWRIDTVTPLGTVTGQVWSFKLGNGRAGRDRS